jgi:Fe2+ or Zn2+ uptake regulation protein
VEPDIEARQHAIATRLGFRIEAHSLVLYGRCQRPDCPARLQGRVKTPE